MKLPRAPDSVLRVESEQDAQHVRKQENEKVNNQSDHRKATRGGKSGKSVRYQT